VTVALDENYTLRPSPYFRCEFLSKPGQNAFYRELRRLVHSIDCFILYSDPAHYVHQGSEFGVEISVGGSVGKFTALPSSMHDLQIMLPTCRCWRIFVTGVELVLPAGAAVRAPTHRACATLSGGEYYSIASRFPLHAFTCFLFLCLFSTATAVHDQPLNKQGAKEAAEVRTSITSRSLVHVPHRLTYCTVLALRAFHQKRAFDHAQLDHPCQRKVRTSNFIGRGARAHSQRAIQSPFDGYCKN